MKNALLYCLEGLKSVSECCLISRLRGKHLILHSYSSIKKKSLISYFEFLALSYFFMIYSEWSRLWDGKGQTLTILLAEAARRQVFPRNLLILLLKGRFYIAVCTHLFTKFTELPSEENNEHTRQVSCILRAFHPVEQIGNNQILPSPKAYLRNVINAVMKNHQKQREPLKGRVDSKASKSVSWRTDRWNWRMSGVIWRKNRWLRPAMGWAEARAHREE